MSLRDKGIESNRVIFDIYIGIKRNIFRAAMAKRKIVMGFKKIYKKHIFMLQYPTEQFFAKFIM